VIDILYRIHKYRDDKTIPICEFSLKKKLSRVTKELKVQAFPLNSEKKGKSLL
jgi:hypothetical protein